MHRIKVLLQKNRKQIYLGLLIGFVLAVGILTPSVSHAISGFSISGLVTGVFKILAYIFNYIGGIAFAFASMLVSFTLDLNMSVADPTKNAIAETGWRITRDIANLGFVLLTVIMAFLTIVRVESFGAKKLLLNLIIAAIVVNFSFLIAGTLIDFSNTLTHFFVGKISPGGTGTGFTEVLANAFGPQRFLLEEEDDPIPPDPSEEESGAFVLGVAILSSLAGLFFIVFFTLLSTIVLLMLAGMFLLRYVVLTYLLILAPLAWLFWVFPNLQSQNAKWWSKFWEYTFFAPAASFFVYLSLLAAERLKSMPPSEIMSGFLPGTLSMIIQEGTNMIIIAALMIGAITVAKTMGIAGASIAEKAKDGLISGAKDYGRKKATNLGTRLSKTTAGKYASNKISLLGKKIKGTGENVEKKRDDMKKAKQKAREDFEKGDINKEQMNARIKAAGKGSTGLWLKDKIYGQRLRDVGTGIEKTGQAIDKRATKEIEKGGATSTMAKHALYGSGLMKEKAKKEDGPKSHAEKEKDLQKTINEKHRLINSGRFKDGDKALSEYDKKIEAQTNDVVKSRAQKYNEMTKEEAQEEYSSILEKEKNAENKDEKELNNRTRKLLEKTLNQKIREKATTPQEIDFTLKEISTKADDMAIEGKDATFYNEMIGSLKRQKSEIEGKLKATGRAFSTIEEKINTLNNTRLKKLADLKESNPNMSNEAIKNHPDIQQIESNIEKHTQNLSKWKSAMGRKINNEEIGDLQNTTIDEMKRVLEVDGNEDIIKALNENQTEIEGAVKEIKEKKRISKEREEKNAKKQTEIKKDLEEIKEKMERKNIEQTKP